MSVPVPRRGEGTLNVNTKALAATVHTFKNLENEKYFPKNQEVFINEMRKCALDVQRLCWVANNIKVDGYTAKIKYERRITLQEMAIEKCNGMIMLIETSKKLFHLRWRKTAYWITLYIDLRSMIASWRDKNVKTLRPRE